MPSSFYLDIPLVQRTGGSSSRRLRQRREERRVLSAEYTSPRPSVSCCSAPTTNRDGQIPWTGIEYDTSFILIDDFPSRLPEINDEGAAACIIRHFTNRHLNPRQLQAERQLIQLILESPLYLSSLEEMLHCADVLFFEGLLEQNVRLEWFAGQGGRGTELRAARAGERRQKEEQASGDSFIIGTTELRQTPSKTFQARIKLSRTILQSEDFDQRLVISAILHEAIHAYLFIRRGFEARIEGGHTPGFVAIAHLIDQWIGDPCYLYLSCVEANLDLFRIRNADHGWNAWQQAWGQCNGFVTTKSSSPE